MKRVATALLIVLALTAFPPAEAQLGLATTRTSVSLDAVPSAVMPLGPGAAVTGVITYVSQAPIVEPVRLRIEIVGAPSWARIAAEPGAFTLDAAGNSQVAAPFTLKVQVSDQAPAFRAIPVEIRAIAEPTTTRSGSEGSVALPLQADFYSLIDIQTTRHVPAPSFGAPSRVPLKLTNFGNADVKVNFAIADNPTAIQVAIPNTKYVGSKQAGAATNSIDLHLFVHGPDGLRDTATVAIRVTTSYILDGRLEGDSRVVEYVIQPANARSDGGRQGAASEGDLKLQTSSGSPLSDLDPRPALPFVGALLGAMAGVVIARRRLQP